MVKLLPLGLVILLLAGFTYYQFYRSGMVNKPIIPPVPAGSNPKAIPTSAPPAAAGSANPAETLNQAAQLEPAVTPVNLEQRVKTLESTIIDLKRRIVNLEQTSTTPAAAGPVASTAPATNKSPVYIPLGSGSSVATDWTSIDSLSVILDSADYSGYSGVQFEVSMRAYQGNGKAFARLYNSTDGTGVLSSEVSTTTSDYTWVTSSSFNISSGKKTYKIQLKSLTGYETGVQNSRIKISF